MINNTNETGNLIVKLKDMYKDHRSMKFVLHIIRAYIPEEKAKEVENFTETNTGVSKCAISGILLTDCANYSNNGHEIALIGVNTNTHISKQSLKALRLFSEDMVKRGDKRIKFALTEEKD